MTPHAESEGGTGGDGAPKWRFTFDANNNLVYWDGGHTVDWAWPDNVRLTDDYFAERDGGTTYHGGLDIAPLQRDGFAPQIFSQTYGTVIKIGATGFGPYSVTVQTPEGYFITYGHLGYNSVDDRDTVFPGEVIGGMGNEGNSTGIHLHYQVTTGAPFGWNSRFLGVHF
jgi:murein DD-endopeptidase MepM/ murein hydrolase activator NlpD